MADGSFSVSSHFVLMSANRIASLVSGALSLIASLCSCLKEYICAEITVLFQESGVKIKCPRTDVRLLFFLPRRHGLGV